MTEDRLRFTVAHNGDPELVPRLADFDSVESVFGKMSVDLVGGGRNSFTLRETNLNQLKYLIDQAHHHKLQFIYLLNAPCMSNLEMTRDFNRQLYSFVGTLVDMGVDAFVVAMPYVLDLIKRHFPSVSVSISTFAIINSITKAKIWDDKGADRIIIMQDGNRDFTLLKKIRQAVSCEIELFANNMCLDQCPYPPFHAAFNAHGSTSTDPIQGFGVDYCANSCVERRLNHPVEFIRGRFIRPEDTHLYQKIGINVFKLSDRTKPTDWIVNVARAYHHRRYDGNLAELIGYPFMRGDNDQIFSKPVKWLLRPDLVNLDILKLIEKIGTSETLVYIDNRKLDGFINHFTTHDCRNAICDEECQHCSKYAKEAVHFNKEKARARAEHHRQLLEMVVDRTAFKNEPIFKRLTIGAFRKATSAIQFGKQTLMGRPKKYAPR